MAVGRARMDGVEVHGNAQLLGMSGFEAYANSTAHRPAQFTFTSSGQSLQVGSMTICALHVSRASRAFYKRFCADRQVCQRT